MKTINNPFYNMQNLLILLALSFSLTGFAQLRFNYEYSAIEPTELIVTYKQNYLRDTTNPDFIRNADMLLFLGKSKSLFISKENYIADTIMRHITNDEEFRAFLLDPNKPFPQFSYRIFKNFPEGQLTFIEHTLDGTFKFEEDLNLFDWQICGDTATISGYKAQKATCNFGGRSWIAWFSPEIPYNDGPYKFNGLPGLVVKVHDTRNHYVFELLFIRIPEKGIMIDMKEKDYVETTKQGFFRAKDAFRDDIISRVKEAGLPSKTQQTAARNMAERNNPIELKRK